MKTKRQVLSLILAAIMVIALFPISIMATSDPDAPAITSLTVRPDVIVAGYAANIKVAVTGNNLDGKTVTVRFADGSDDEPSATVTNGAATIYVPKAPGEEGAYDIIAAIDGLDVPQSGTIYVEAVGDNIWTINTVKDENSDALKVQFYADISSKTGSFDNCVFVNGAAKGPVTLGEDGRSLVVPGAAFHSLRSGDVLKITGIKYARLFPSYSFTFTHVIPASDVAFDSEIRNSTLDTGSFLTGKAFADTAVDIAIANVGGGVMVLVTKADVNGRWNVQLPNNLPSGLYSMTVASGNQTDTMSATVENSDQFADTPYTGQLRVYGGATTGYITEQYLLESSGSSVRRHNVIGQRAQTVRYLTGSSGYYTYRLPLLSDTSGPVYVSMETMGKLKLSVNGQEIYKTTTDNNTTIVPREFVLTDPSLWANGYIDLRVENAGTGAGAHVAWIELGQSSRWRDRASHIVWDTTGVVAQFGYYDGTANEFGGASDTLSAGEDIAALKDNGAIVLKWAQAVEPGKEYWLLAGVIGGDANVQVDVQNDGTIDMSRTPGGEKIYDLAITSLIAAGDNQVKIILPANAKLDFTTIVEATPGAADNLRVAFKGSEMAENWSRLVNNTMYWHNEYMTMDSTGYLDASFPHGLFPGLDWTADSAPGALETTHWGYYDTAKQMTLFHDALHYFNDNGAAGLFLSSMAHLIKADNYKGAYVDKAYPQLQAGMNEYARLIANSPVHMIKGTAGETTGSEYAIYNNSIAYYALLLGVDVADAMGRNGDAQHWREHARLLKEAIEKYLILTDDTTHDGRLLNANTWLYAVNKNGEPSNATMAGWFGIGTQEELAFGYKGASNPELDAWRNVTNNTLAYHSNTFWTNWKLYGSNRGFGTNYGCLTERGGWPLGAMLLSDQMDMTKKNLEHVIYNSSDLNFAHDNDARQYQETGPWLMIRETNGQDNGVALSSEIGNTAWGEDMNGVEYCVTMRNARLMAGVDDTLANGDNVNIIPRVPKDWGGATVTGWPVVYRVNDNELGKAKVSYDFTLTPEKGTMTLSATKAIAGVQIRMGPFAPGFTAQTVTVNGKAVAVNQETAGDSVWVWVTANIGPNAITVNVDGAIPGQVHVAAQQVYDAALNGSDGSWTAGTTLAHTGAQSEILYAGNQNETAIGADVFFNGTSGKAGLVFNGYRFYLDLTNGKIVCETNTGAPAALYTSAINVRANRTYSLRAVAYPGHVLLYLNGVLVSAIENATVTNGPCGYWADGSVTISNSVVSRVVASLEKMRVERIELIVQNRSMWDYQAYPVQIRKIYNTGKVELYSGEDIAVTSSDNTVIAVAGGQIRAQTEGLANLTASYTENGVTLTSPAVAMTVNALLPQSTVLFQDDFETASSDWSAIQGANDWTVENGVLRKPRQGGDTVAQRAGFANTADFAYAADVTITEGNAAGLAFRNNSYKVILDKVMNQVKLSRIVGGYSEIKSASYPVLIGRTYNVAVRATGKKFYVYVDGALVLEHTDTSSPAYAGTGAFGFMTFEAGATFDNVIAKAATVPTDLQADQPAVILGIDETEQLKAVFTPANPSFSGLIWQSSDPTIVSVDENGKLTPFNDGLATVTIRSEGLQLTKTIQVVVEPMNTVLKETFDSTAALNGWNASGSWVVENGQCVASGSGQLIKNGLTLGNLSLSADVSLAVGSQAGLLLGTGADGAGGYRVMLDKEAGKVTLVTGSTILGSASLPASDSSYKVRVTVESGAIDVYVGDMTSALIAVIGTEYANGCVGIAAQGGASFDNVKAHKPGQLPTGLTLDITSAIIDIGEPLYLTAAVQPIDTTYKTVRWSSNDPSVASVNAYGVVTGVSSGTAVITATTGHGGFSQSCTVVVSGKGYGMREDFQRRTDWSGWTLIGHEWTIENGYAKVTGSGDGWAIYDGYSEGDFVYTADVVVGGTSAGLAFRVNDNGGTLNSGFEFIIDRGSNIVKIARRSPYYSELARTVVALYNYPLDHIFKLKIVARGSLFTCYMDDMDKPIVSVANANNPSGKFGLFNYSSTNTYDNLVISPYEETKPAYDLFYQNTGVSLADFLKDWTVTEGPASGFKISYGNWIEMLPASTGTYLMAIKNDVTAQNFSFSSDFYPSSSSSGIGGIAFRYNESTKSGYVVTGNPVTNEMRLVARTGDNERLIASVNTTTLPENPFALVFKDDITKRLKIVANGTNIKVYVDEVLVINATDSEFTKGKFGLVATKATMWFCGEIFAESLS